MWFDLKAGTCTSSSFPLLLGFAGYRGKMGEVSALSFHISFLGSLAPWVTLDPSLPCFSLSICIKKPSPWCKVSLSLCMSVRMGSCKQMLRSHSLNQRTAFHLLQFLCALDPSLSLFLALILLEQAGPSRVWISRGWEHHLLSFRSCWGLAWEQQKEQRWWGREGPAESPWFKCYFEFTKSESVFFFFPCLSPSPRSLLHFPLYGPKWGIIAEFGHRS